MKKLICAVLAIMTAVLIFVIPSSAGGIFTVDEEEAGFSFDYIYVILKPEYSFDEFLPEDFDADLVERIDEPYPFNPDTDYEYGFHKGLRLYLKEPSKENVLTLFLLLKENEYVHHYYLHYINGYIPIYPNSSAEMSVYRGGYKPTLTSKNDSSGYVIKNMLFNPYYQMFYDLLLTKSYDFAEKFTDYLGDVDYIDEYYIKAYADTTLSEEIASFVTLIFKKNSDFEGTVREYNMSVLRNRIPEENILYVGDTVPAAVVKVSADDAEMLKNMEELAFISDAFFQPDQLTSPNPGGFLLGDVITEGHYDPGIFFTDICYSFNDESKVTAADARYILRYCAGLEDPGTSKRFYYCADVDMDGEITSADARLALRIAAGIEPAYRITFDYPTDWCDDIAPAVPCNGGV